MFRRRSKEPSSADQEGQSTSTSAVESGAGQAQQPKGHATPSRKDAEQHRKQTLKVPSDPKAAKKAMKQRNRDARAEARAGLMAGDERYLPARDQGAAKAFTRDTIDSRRRLAEYFVFVAVGILIAGFIGGQAQGTISIIWFVVTGGVVLEVAWILTRLNRELKERWPEKSDRKGCLPYAAMRQLQIRRLRIPPPRIKPGSDPS
jgi:hypothetical protein